MKDLRKLEMTKRTEQESREQMMLYNSMSRGKGVTEKMKENWKRKPYYMEGKKND